MNNTTNTQSAKTSTGKVKAFILSGLLFPGLGQLTQGKKLLGFMIIAGTFICLLVVFSTAMGEINAAAERIINEGSMDAFRIQQEAHQVLTELKTPGFLFALYSLIALWFFSMVEIFRPTKK